jgi:hypothetical protein
MPLTPPADEPTFHNLDAMTKAPDTPMADQFEIDDLESMQSETELDDEKAHLITHAKVYAIAEKYVCFFVISCFIQRLIAYPCLPFCFHLRLQIVQCISSCIC